MSNHQKALIRQPNDTPGFDQEPALDRSQEALWEALHAFCRVTASHTTCCVVRGDLSSKALSTLALFMTGELSLWMKACHWISFSASVPLYKHHLSPYYVAVSVLLVGETKKQQGGLEGARTPTYLWLSASPLLVNCVPLELLPKASEPGFPTCKMRLIIYMVFRIEKWFHLRYSMNDSHLFFSVPLPSLPPSYFLQQPPSCLAFKEFTIKLWGQAETQTKRFKMGSGWE